MASKSILSEWPPSLSKDQLEALTLYATTYALSHGLLYLPPTLPQPPAPTASIHAPLSLFPSPFPRRLFQQAQKLQSTYNVLYARIAMDEEFLDNVMGAVHGVGQVDDFVGTLWTGWKQLRDEGRPQVCKAALSLNITPDLRSGSATGLVSIRLSPACSRQRGDIAEASRVQHHIFVIWDAF